MSKNKDYHRRIVNHNRLGNGKIALDLECGHRTVIDTRVTERDIADKDFTDTVFCTMCESKGIVLNTPTVSDVSKSMSNIPSWKLPYIDLVDGLLISVADRVHLAMKIGADGEAIPLEEIQGMTRALNELYNLDIYIREGDSWDDPLFDERYGIDED